MDTEHLVYVSYYSVFCKKIPELDMHLNNTVVVLTHFTTLHVSPSKASSTFLPMVVMCNLEAPILTDAAETDAFNTWETLWSLPDPRYGSFVPQSGQGLTVILEYVKAEVILQSKFDRNDTSNS